MIDVDDQAQLGLLLSGVRSLPSAVDEKPHCGERQSWSSGTYRLASSMRRLIFRPPYRAHVVDAPGRRGRPARLADAVDGLGQRVGVNDAAGWHAGRAAAEAASLTLERDRLDA